MKRSLLILIIIGCIGIMLYAQTAPKPAPKPVAGFQGVQSYVEKTEMVIEVKSLIPSTTMFQDKADTYRKSGDYKFSFSLETIRENSDALLNKWLKESK